MKKFLSIILCLIMVLVSLPINAEDFTFDIYDSFSAGNTDELTLMEVDEEAKAALEEKLFAAWNNMDTEVQLYPDVKIHKDDIVKVFSSILFENPQYYYIVKSFSATLKDAGYIGELYNLSYTVDSMDEVKETWAEVDKATEEILFNISPDMTDFEKIVTVHDYMVNNYVYDLADMDQTYFILLKKKGVCIAYAEAFQHVMNVLGIECTVVKSEEMGHTWNMVKLDDRWYHIDVTWDDPRLDRFAQMSHEFMLLSESEIKASGHTGFEAPYYAESTTYTDAPWRDEPGALVTADGIMYRIEGNNLIDENGNIIYKDLDGGDGYWDTSETTGVKNAIFAGLCEINDVLYFNTDTGIYSYNPKTKETECVLEDYGLFGLYADKNTVFYGTYDFNTGTFIKKGELQVCQTFVKEPYYENGKAVVKLYNDYDSPVWIISKGDGYKIHKADAKSITIAQFENGSEQTIYVWKNSLEPVVGTFIVSE
ncbi:MAG: hypothetical protein IJ435_04065 [Clostridia bacterium]|nr:hypothetical protein [Clostridia bacterium]